MKSNLFQKGLNKYFHSVKLVFFPYSIKIQTFQILSYKTWDISQSQSIKKWSFLKFVFFYKYKKIQTELQIIKSIN